jgi:hypothetical protein
MASVDPINIYRGKSIPADKSPKACLHDCTNIDVQCKFHAHEKSWPMYKYILVQDSCIFFL